MTVMDIRSGMTDPSHFAIVTMQMVHSRGYQLPVAIELHSGTNGVDTVSF